MEQMQLHECGGGRGDREAEARLVSVVSQGRGSAFIISYKEMKQ